MWQECAERLFYIFHGVWIQPRKSKVNWDIETAIDTYRLKDWGEGYFSVNSAGDLCVSVDPENRSDTISLSELVQRLQRQQIHTPLLVRFTDILKHRITTLENCFQQVIEHHGYAGEYYPVYPIKVNQQSQVISSLLQAGSDKFGLEAGSKPELLAVMASLPVNQGLIVCNGYKDAEYIKLALMAQQMGHQVHIVIEKPFELDLIMKLAQQLEVLPTIGVRVKLSAMGSGNWQNSGGVKSKFGLDAIEFLSVLEQLKGAQAHQWLTMLHVHMGSQITDLNHIQICMHEAAQYFRAAQDEGFDIQYIDVGGGLGVDYEGTRSTQYCSVNYQLAQYADTVISSLSEICHQYQLKQPNVVTESGRWLTAHHTVLITDVVTVGKKQVTLRSDLQPDNPSQSYSRLEQLVGQLASFSTLPFYEEIQAQHQCVQKEFQQGEISLQELAAADALLSQAQLSAYHRLMNSKDPDSSLLVTLEESIADTYFCNFSLFQSVPDVWGIEQIFPIVPLSGLDQIPDARGVIRDITCDSDGRIDRYVDAMGITHSLPLHRLEDTSHYYLGIFLVGAYQEILGDMHNLFGDLHSICVDVAEQGVRIHHVKEGEDVATVLHQVGFDAETIKNCIGKKTGQSQLSIQHQEEIKQAVNNALQQFTYLNACETNSPERSGE